MKKAVNRISCIMVQVTSVPKDENARQECLVGTRHIINKKKYPYLIKFGYIKLKKGEKVCTLYIDEVEIILERKMLKEDYQCNF
jgi:ethanolamine utilization protein EutQ (cupin superfamily)